MQKGKGFILFHHWPMPVDCPEMIHTVSYDGNRQPDAIINHNLFHKGGGYGQAIKVLIEIIYPFMGQGRFLPRII